MPASTDGFDIQEFWDQVTCHRGNKFCMVLTNIFGIIITHLFSYIKNTDQFTRTEQKLPGSIEVQGSCQNGCSVRTSLMSPTWHQKFRGGS